MDQHLSVLKGMLDQDLKRSLENHKQQIADYKDRIKIMIEAEVALRDCLEATAKELEICKEHFKTKVKEGDALEL